MDLGTLSLGDALSPITRVRRLFTAGELGVWYDPSDLGALFQDSAGTTPVTAVTQPVGLMLDKSKGLVLGPDVAVNGGFDTDTGWSKPVGGTIAGGAAVFTNVASTLIFSQNVLTIGKSYRISYEITEFTAGAVSLLGTGGTLQDVQHSSVGVYYETVVNATSATLSIKARGTTTLKVDNVTARELPGYHATQPTSTARPVVGTNLIDFDGVDDAVTLAGSGGGTSGFFLCAAVRPDGGAGAIRTIWSDAGTNTGYIVRLNALNQLEIAAGNGTTYTLAATTATLTVGTTYVITAWDDGTNLNVQVNSGTAGTAARPVVTAGTATATIGKDNGAATGFFNGAIYPLIYVKNGQNVDALDRAAAKAYVAGKAGVGI